MSGRRILLPLVAALLVTGITVGAGAQPMVGPPIMGPATAPPPPPALREELVPGVPRGAWIWQPGHWNYDGREYVWVGGRYVPERRGRWTHGYWGYAANGWVWVPGHFVP